MKALCWHGPKDVQVNNVPDPTIINPRDAIIEVKKSAICGSDLHLYHGFILGMKKGDVLGHEFCGEVVEVGSEVKRFKKGDRVVIPFTICCGQCRYCKAELWALCDNTNPNGAVLAKVIGYPAAGLYGYSHLYGGYPGGQAQYVRVPFVDVVAMTIPEGLDYEDVLFLSDVFPTGYMAADNCEIKSGDTVAVWGCGPVGLFAIKSAFILGAERVIAIDRFHERLALAQEAGAQTIDYTTTNVLDAIQEMTGGMGPEACIDAVGMEAHGTSLDALYDEVAQKVRLETDRAHAIREAIMVCGKSGRISIPGVYIGLVDKFPLGIAFAKGLTFRMGQTHMIRYMQTCLDLIKQQKIDPRFIISHRMSLEEAPHAYDIWSKKEESATKIVLSPVS